MIMLPHATASVDLNLQAKRIMTHLAMKHTDLDRYFILTAVATQNSTLFYHLLVENLAKLAPIVYTPTVGDACLQFHKMYRAPIGMCLSAWNCRGRFKQALSTWPSKSVQIIVVTDGGRILGLGDLGTNGMGISLGKIQLYVAGAGFHPMHSLPILLDCGTDNKELINDELYMGTKKPRIRGEAHLAVVEEFCMAVKEIFPYACIQFEDFQSDMAFAILHRMRDKVLCFNDDIQGTGAVVTSGFINGMKAQGTPLKDARIVFFGAGSSAVGVAKSIASYIELKGKVSAEDARKAIFLMDSKGLITSTRGDVLPNHKQHFCRRDETPDMKSLVEVIEYVNPHALIGLTGAGPLFDRDVVEAMCHSHPSPLIFPLSNPTSKAEITAQNAYSWSKGKCIFASGTAFAPVDYNGRRFEPGQANNVLIFPGVGFGACITKATWISDGMFTVAAQRLADYVMPDRIQAGILYPALEHLRDISLKVAEAVAEQAFVEGVARIDRPRDLHEWLRHRMWSPRPVMSASKM